MEVNNWDMIVEKALSDSLFKKRLLAEPEIVLAEQGTVIPKGVSVTIVESTPTQVWLVLPKHRERVKFLSPYVAVREVDGVEIPGCDPITCKNPAAGCAK